MSVTQELPKYLRGFHKCSQEDAVHLAGLIYKAQFDNDRSQLASIPKILRQLVPENLTRLMSSEEWKKVLDGAGEGVIGCQALPGLDDHILVMEGVLGLQVSPPPHAIHSTWGIQAPPRGIEVTLGSEYPPGWPRAHTCHFGASRTLCGGLGQALAPAQALTGPSHHPQNILLAYDKNKNKTVEEAKMAFLKWICRWPTFGSAFFEVKVGLTSRSAVPAQGNLTQLWPQQPVFLSKHTLKGGPGHLVWTEHVCTCRCTCVSQGGSPWPPQLGCDHCVPPSPANLRALLPGHHPHRHQPTRGSAHPPQDQGNSQAPAGLGKLPGGPSPRSPHSLHR